MHKNINNRWSMFAASRLTGLGLLLAFGSIFSPIVNAQVSLSLGLAGDSVIDDYLGPDTQGNTNLAAGSFGQILGELRSDQIDFGAYKSVNDGAWDTIRNSGYEYNFATAGGVASSSAVVKLLFAPNTPDAPLFMPPIEATLEGQVLGMAPLITEGNITAAFIQTGGNDFFFRANVIDTAGGGLLPATDFTNGNGEINSAFINDVADSILSAVDILQDAGPVNIVLGTLPKIPEIMNQDALDGVDAVNAILLAGALERNVAIFNTGITSWSSVGTYIDPLTGDITIGDLMIEFGSRATGDDISQDVDGLFCNNEGYCPLDSHHTKFLAEDGIHLNTLVQGLMANEIVGVFNEAYGYEIDLLTEGELLSLVGISEVPVPAAVWLFGSALAGLGWMRRKQSV